MLKAVKCPCCRKKFMPFRSNQKTCSKKCTDRIDKLKRRYRTTPIIIYAMYKLQKGRCAICFIRGDIHELGYMKRRPFCIDHDHKTGEVRGLLCNECNKGLGMFKDNSTFLKLAIKYLIKHGTAQKKSNK